MNPYIKAAMKIPRGPTGKPLLSQLKAVRRGVLYKDVSKMPGIPIPQNIRTLMARRNVELPKKIHALGMTKPWSSKPGIPEITIAKGLPKGAPRKQVRITQLSRGLVSGTLPESEVLRHEMVHAYDVLKDPQWYRKRLWGPRTEYRAFRHGSRVGRGGSFLAALDDMLASILMRR